MHGSGIFEVRHAHLIKIGEVLSLVFNLYPLKILGLEKAHLGSSAEQDLDAASLAGAEAGHRMVNVAQQRIVM